MEAFYRPTPPLLFPSLLLKITLLFQKTLSLPPRICLREKLAHTFY